MILCRTNAPLVSQYFRFMARNIRASILGRKMGEGLIALLDKFNVGSVRDLAIAIETWCDAKLEEENAKKFPSENYLATIRDKHDCIMSFLPGCASPNEVRQKIDRAFADKRCSKCGAGYPAEAKRCQQPLCNGAELVTPRGVKLASIHKAKGLEARRVFFLTPRGAECPMQRAKMSDWQMVQEMNLRYVGITRAIEELVWVS
jgi:hypothetical protein